METKILLKTSEIPIVWYSIMADMPNPLAPESAHAIHSKALGRLPKVGA
jgi:predicted alternative tryptophan synthase beta-subunit